MIDRQKAAQQAVSEIDKRLEQPLDGSEVGAAKEYVDQAIETMYQESGGYDPDTLAEQHAYSAVVEYAKARLIGQEPQNANGYIRAVDKWSNVAAVKHHQQGHNL